MFQKTEHTHVSVVFMLPPLKWWQALDIAPVRLWICLFVRSNSDSICVLYTISYLTLFLSVDKTNNYQ